MTALDTIQTESGQSRSVGWKQVLGASGPDPVYAEFLLILNRPHATSMIYEVVAVELWCGDPARDPLIGSYMRTTPTFSAQATGSGKLADAVRLVHNPGLAMVGIEINLTFDVDVHFHISYDADNQSEGTLIGWSPSGMPSSTVIATHPLADKVVVSRNGILAVQEAGVEVLDDLADVATAGQAAGMVLTSDGANWTPQTPPATGAQTLDELTDVATTGQAAGMVLTSDGALWTPQTPAAGATNLDELTDVDTSTVAPIANDVLKFDGATSLWKPGVAAAVDLTPYARKYNATYWTFTPNGNARIYAGEDRVYYTDSMVAWSVLIQMNNLALDTYIEIHSSLPTWALWQDGWSSLQLIATRKGSNDGDPGPVVTVRIGQPGTDNLDISVKSGGSNDLTTDTVISLNMTYPRFYA